MAVPILKTKLHCPSPPLKYVRRTALCKKLNEGLEAGRELTLVSAPAGFGKTTCISEWIQSLDRPVAWLSLDPADDDPGRFFVYLLAVLQTVDPRLGEEIFQIIRAGQLPPGEIISATIINEILELNHPFLLVLDDFHLIQDNNILEVLENLVLNHPPPLHIVLLTREDPPLPLARLRANNKMTEVRAKDLRFSGSDIKALLNDVLALPLSSTDIAVLEEKTEGWVAGLQLAGISVKEKSNPSGFISGLSGGHHYFMSYLTEQVLDQQPEEIREFLLQTAVLEKFNIGLCNAVTQRSNALDVIERIKNANLFLIPLDDEHQWYRYHHLFADLLRVYLQRVFPDQVTELHLRASRWYVEAGMPSEAVQHALAGKDYATALDLVEDHALEMVMHGYAKTVNGWVQAFPEEWRAQSPKTHLAFAWMHLLGGTYAEATPYLQAIQDVFSEIEEVGEDTRSIEAEWLVMRSLMLMMEGKVEESMVLVKRAGEIVPVKDKRVLSMVYFGQANAYQSSQSYAQIADTYTKAIHYAQMSGNIVTQMLSISGLAQLAFEHGQLKKAFDISKPVCDRLEQSPSLSPISTVVFGILGEIYYQWYQLENARHYFEHAEHLSALGGFYSGMINCHVLLSRSSLMAGDLEAAADEIARAEALIPSQIPEYVRLEVLAQKVRVFLAQKQTQKAQIALTEHGFSFQPRFSFPELPDKRRISYSEGLFYNSSLHVLLSQARTGQDASNLLPGFELVNQILTGFEQVPPTLTVLEALLLRAQMHAEAGHAFESEKDMLEAVALGELGGFIGVFLEQGEPVADALTDLLKRESLDGSILTYVRQILSAFSEKSASSREEPGSQPSSIVDAELLVEQLTERELEVLRLMGEGLSYKEIAAHLYISLNTVRYHVKAIYGKLNVNNRTLALEKARQLNIL